MKNIIYLFITILLFSIYKNSYATWSPSIINKINLVTDWNTNYANPFVITTPINKMWFSGHIGWWVIGTANYVNNNWVGNNTIAVNHDNLIKEIISSNIIYDQDSKLYRMWYIGLVNNDWQSGVDRFRLFYTYSLDSIIWSSPILTLKGEESCIYEDCGGINRGISIIKYDNKYHLWYTATNSNDMGSNPFWKIWYATSDDGISWEKQNDKLPVISTTTSFDLKNQSYPNVILYNNKFLMWYGAGSKDMPTQYNFAESDDGIHWYKPPEINPVLTVQPNTFYSGNLAGNQTLEEGDNYHIYFSGHNGSVWSIGEAYVSKSDYALYITPAPTPLPTPEITATPQPTSTPIPPTQTPVPPTETPIPPTNTPIMPTTTPIPTNTQTPAKPPTVIIIPGITASWNTNALMQCQPGDNGGTWTYLPIVAKNLYTISEKALIDAGFPVLHFLYDWRIPVSQNADRLARFISEKTDNEQIYLLGHSMGGLIARSYGEKYHTNSPVEKILTVGAPFEGSVNAYYTWSGGEFLGDLMSKFYATLLLSRCTQFKFKTGADAIHTFIPSISDLLPTFSYLVNKQTNALIPISSMQAQNTLQKDSSYQNPYFSITTGSLLGSGKQTAQTITVTVPKKKSSVWADGQPISSNAIDYSMEGDGTVLVQSAQTIGNTLSDQELSHSELMTDPISIQTIISFFRGTSQQTRTLSVEALKGSNTRKKSTPSLLSFVGYPMKFIVFPPHGTPIQDTNGLIELENPEDGNYRILVQPTDETSTLSIGSMKQTGEISWKSHDFHTVVPKILNFHLKK